MKQESFLGIQLFLMMCIMAWLTGAYFLIAEGSHYLFQVINQSYTATLDEVVPWITRLGEAWVIAPLLLLLLFIPAYRNKYFFILLALTQLIPLGITHLLKQIYQAPRPMHFFEQATWFHYVVGQPKQYIFSFPSGHTSGSFAMLTFIALLLPKRLAWISVLLAFVGIAVGVSRVYLSQHFIEDILAGSIIGTVFSILTYYIATYFIQKRQLHAL